MRRRARADAFSRPVVGIMALLLLVVLSRSAVVGAVDEALNDPSLQSVTEGHPSLANKLISTHGIGEPAASRELGVVGEGF